MANKTIPKDERQAQYAAVLNLFRFKYPDLELWRTADMTGRIQGFKDYKASHIAIDYCGAVYAYTTQPSCTVEDGMWLPCIDNGAYWSITELTILVRTLPDEWLSPLKPRLSTENALISRGELFDTLLARFLGLAGMSLVPREWWKRPRLKELQHG